MSKAILGITLAAVFILGGLFFWRSRTGIKEEGVAPTPKPSSEVAPGQEQPESSDQIPLPSPKTKGEVSLEEAILRRRSQRNFSAAPLTLEELSQILWAGQGITDEASGFRAAPSAGALYPLDIYIVIGEEGVTDLDSGVYHFLPENHSLKKISEGDLRNDLMKNCLGQSFIADAPISLVITAEYERTTVKYGERGIRYVHLEAGHAAQNIYLQVASLGLGTVTVGAFDDEAISQVLNLPEKHQPLYVMPIGHVK